MYALSVLFLIIASPSFLDAASFGVKETGQPSALLRHELSNLQEEMRVTQEKIQNQEDIIEALKHEIDSSKRKSLEEVKGKQGNFDQKLAVHDSTIKGFAEDLKELKNHSNKNTLSLQESDTRIKDLEKTIKKQSESIEHLRSALSSLIDGIKGPDSSQDNPGSYTIYEVKSGDSLGVIAQKNKVSIKLLKELNQLKSDSIFKGQKLKIPDNS